MYVGMVGDAYQQPFTNDLQAFAVSIDKQVQKDTLSDDEAAAQWQKEIAELNARIQQQSLRQEQSGAPVRVWDLQGDAPIATKEAIPVVHN